MKKVALLCCLLTTPAFAAANSTITEDQDRIIVELTGAPSDNRTTDAGAPSTGSSSFQVQEDTSYVNSEIDRLNTERDQIRQQAFEGEPVEDAQRRRIKMSDIANEIKALQSRRLSPALQ